MAWGFGREKQLTTSFDNGQYSPNSPNEYGYQGDALYDDDLHIQCPPHTTERKLVRRVDLRVMPFLCILYLLAFLDR